MGEGWGEVVEGSISLLLLADLVLRQLFHLHTVQELLGAVAGSVRRALGAEYHVDTIDVLGIA